MIGIVSVARYILVVEKETGKINVNNSALYFVELHLSFLWKFYVICTFFQCSSG